MWILSPFPLLMFLLYCKCFRFNSVAYILSFLVCEATRLCPAYGLPSSKQLFVPDNVAPVCFFQIGDLSLMISLTRQIYSSLKTSETATWQYFWKDTMHSCKKPEMFNKHFFFLVITDIFRKLVVLSVWSKSDQVLQFLSSWATSLLMVASH